ncbi:MAG TPA: Asp23/Gls24 family envelope stress response protein [Anaerolineales bacterium]|nr:Asp23/Gls24 family envelope stress response protein [Anaerolineales bacterium]
MEFSRPPGKTTIDPGVLLAIARLTALSVEGVSRMGEVPGSLRRIFQRNSDQGVRIEVADGVVDVEIHVVLHAETDMRSVSREIQVETARAISEMVGMRVGHIGVHIDDIDFVIPREEEISSET